MRRHDRWAAELTASRLVCKYLAKNARGAKWAAAGRSKEKIVSVLKKHGIESQPILIADSDDESALTDLAKETKVIITLVRVRCSQSLTDGSGRTLLSVRIEARQGLRRKWHALPWSVLHAQIRLIVADLTGETPWAAKMIQSEHRKALVGVRELSR